MADVYAQARALVRAVRESPEWLDLQKLTFIVRADPAVEQMLSQFRLAQFEIQAQLLQGQQPSAQQQADIQRLVQQMQERPALVQYLEAETQYGALLAEVQRVLQEVFEPDLPGPVQLG